MNMSLSWYGTAQFTLVAVALFTWVQARWARDSFAALKACRWAVAWALLAPVVIELMPTDTFWKPATQIWSVPLASGGATLTASALPDLSVTLSGVQLATVNWLAIAGWAGALVWMLLNLANLKSRLSKGTAWRRIGKVELRVNRRSTGTFAAWWPGRVIVVIDQDALLNPIERSLAVRHELQHHRHADPLFAWFLMLLRAVFWWNPAAHLFARSMGQLEELAVDAALLGRGVDPHAYGSCLIRAAAKNTKLSGLMPGLTSGLFGRGRFLKRRLEKMTLSVQHKNPVAALVIAALLIVASAWAAPAIYHEKLDVERADLALEAVAAMGWDVDVPDVKFALEQLVEQRPGRVFSRSALSARKDFSGIVDDALRRYRLPRFLAALPFVESGYRNLPQRKGPSAGLWQFIAPTGRRYGLEISGAIDERMDVELQTDAAMRLLTDLHAEFGDWGLALAGYNQGAAAVRRAIEEGHTKDAFKLIDAGLLNEYAVRVAAAAVLMEAPELLGEDPTHAKVSMRLRDAEFKSVLGRLAERADLDLELRGTYEAKVSLDLNDVEWREALDLLLDSNGLRAEVEGPTLVISPK